MGSLDVAIQQSRFSEGLALIILFFTTQAYHILAFDPTVVDILDLLESSSARIRQPIGNPTFTFDYISNHPDALLRITTGEQRALLRRFTVRQILRLFFDASDNTQIRAIIKTYAESFNIIALTDSELSIDLLENISTLYTSVRGLIITRTAQCIINRDMALAIVRYFPRLTYLNISGNRIDQSIIDILKNLPELGKFSFTLRNATFTLEGHYTIKNWNTNSYTY